MFDSPKFLFWKVGTGDSTTIVVKEGVVLQVDLHHIDASDDEHDDHTPVVDRLVEHLPKGDNGPYLSAFALTHPDKDHIQGFENLLDQVTIGQLWFTPRIFNEFNDDLCDDAIAFRNEAMRRVKVTIEKSGDVSAGDRVRLVGYDSLLEKDGFEGFPEDLLTTPGEFITLLDGEELGGEFRAFIHAPFKDDDQENDRNDTSMAMQVVLGDDPSQGGVLLFGDISYPIIRRIFEESKAHDNEDALAWQVFLAPHHCSKSIMYQKDGETQKFMEDIMTDLDAAQVGDGYIIASSESVPSSNKKGDNPPHAKAKAQYEEIAGGAFRCTHDDAGDEECLTFTSDSGSITFDNDVSEEKAVEDTVAAGVIAARGSDEPSTEDIGFGS